MGTNKKKLVRGLKYELIALPLLILGPILITIGYKSINLDKNYMFLIAGIVVATAAIIFGFLGLKIILDAFFDND
jgi:hypothetical protein